MCGIPDYDHVSFIEQKQKMWRLLSNEKLKESKRTSFLQTFTQALQVPQSNII